MGDVSGRGAFRRRAPGARRQSRRRRRKPRSGRGMRRAGPTRRNRRSTAGAGQSWPTAPGTAGRARRRCRGSARRRSAVGRAVPRRRGRDRNGDPHDPRRRPARCRRRRLCPGLRRRNESMGQTTPSTRPRWSGCSTPRSVRISRRGSSNTSGAASRDPPPSGPGLILPGRGTAPASTGPRSATTPSPSSCAADTTPLQVVAVYRTQRRSWRVMTEHVGALLDEYPGPAEHDATGGGQGRLPVKATAKRSRSTPPHGHPAARLRVCLPWSR